jgi:copper transport protein
MVRPRVALGAVVLFALGALLLPAVSLAHTKLSSSKPAGGATLERAPAAVVLSFSTDVSDTLQDVKVIAPDGSNVAESPTAAGARVTVPVQATEPGSYLVGWRTLGADGHPITGEFSFTVRPPQTPPATPDDVAPPPAAEAKPHVSHEQSRALEDYPRVALDRIGAIARFAFYFTLLLVAGAGIFATMIARGWRPRLFRRSCLLLIVSAFAVFFTNLALAGEYSLLGVVNPWNIVPHAATPQGRVLLACALVAGLLLRSYGGLKEASKTGNTAARKRFAALAVLLAIIPAFGGHAIASQEPWLRVPADMLHLLAASIWFGGIVQLQGVASASYATHPAVYPAVHRFARLAFASVVTLVVTGTIAAWLEIGMDVDELFGSTYGQLVLLKVVLLGLTIPLAMANQRRHVPALQEMKRRSSANLRRYVAFELMLVVMIIGVTSWLVYETPPRHAQMGHDLHAS